MSCVPLSKARNHSTYLPPAVIDIAVATVNVVVMATASAGLIAFDFDIANGIAGDTASASALARANPNINTRSVQNASTPFESRGLETTLRRASSRHREPRATPRRASSKVETRKRSMNPCLVEVPSDPAIATAARGSAEGAREGAVDRRTRGAIE